MNLLSKNVKKIHSQGECILKIILRFLKPRLDEQPLLFRGS